MNRNLCSQLGMNFSTRGMINRAMEMNSAAMNGASTAPKAQAYSDRSSIG